jgi:hypothetical protein
MLKRHPVGVIAHVNPGEGVARLVECDFRLTGAPLRPYRSNRLLSSRSLLSAASASRFLVAHRVHFTSAVTSRASLPMCPTCYESLVCSPRWSALLLQVR